MLSRGYILALVLVSLAWHGALCAQRPDGEPCSFYNVDPQSSAGRRGGLGNRFQLAAANGDLTCMREFHAAGDNINAGNRFGANSVHSTAYGNHVDALRLLIELGAKLNVMHPRDGTALSVAGCRGFLEFVKVLLAAGADKSFTNLDYETPFSKVCQCSSCSDATASELRNRLGGVCGVLANFDLPSKKGILNNGKKDITSSNDECCAKCSSTPNCKAWTRIKKDKKYNRAGECWLRDFIPSRTSCSECDSGTVA